jgi:hypothetical protein
MIKFITKGFILVLAIGFLFSGFAFSQTVSTNNYGAKDLSLYEKMNVYSKLKSSPTDSVLFASTFGLGTGSYIQNDWAGGVIGMSADLAGLALILWGNSINIESQASWLSSEKNNEISKNQQNRNLLLTSGAIVLLSSRIFQIVRPVIVAEEKNNNLAVRLGLAVDFKY